MVVRGRHRIWHCRHEGVATLVPASGSIAVSEGFDDPDALLAAAEQNGLEGIVSKRIDHPYRSRLSLDWVKVKTKAWRDANRERGKLFEAANKKMPRRRGRGSGTMCESAWNSCPAELGAWDRRPIIDRLTSRRMPPLIPEGASRDDDRGDDRQDPPCVSG